MNPKKEKYFHESMDGKIHSRVYKRFAPSLKKEKITPKNMILNGKMILAEDDDLEYADAWDKNDNGIPDYAEDDR